MRGEPEPKRWEEKEEEGVGNRERERIKKQMKGRAAGKRQKEEWREQGKGDGGRKEGREGRSRGLCVLSGNDRVRCTHQAPPTLSPAGPALQGRKRRC